VSLNISISLHTTATRLTSRTFLLLVEFFLPQSAIIAARSILSVRPCVIIY